MTLFYHIICPIFKIIKNKIVESSPRYNIFTGVSNKKYSTLTNAKINDIPMIGMRHLKLKGINDTKFWNEFISTSTNSIDVLSPHSLAILSSVITHLIPNYPESKICIQKIFDTITRRPVILKGLNAELLNMMLVSYHSFKNEIDPHIVLQIAKRCNEEICCFNKNVVEINIEIMHSLAKCIRNVPKLSYILDNTGIFNTFNTFLLQNIHKLNPRELSITVYSLSTFSTPDPAVVDLVYDAVRRNENKFQPLDISTMIFASKEHFSQFKRLIHLLTPMVSTNLLKFTPQQISNLLHSYLKYNSIDTGDNEFRVHNEVNLLVRRASDIFMLFKPQEVFNIVNSMIRYSFSPSSRFLNSYSHYLLNSSFKNFKMVDLFTLFNSLSQWIDPMIECLGNNFTTITNKSSAEMTKYFNKNLSLEKLIYILHYISRVSDAPNCAIDSAIKLISSSELSRLSVKEFCLIKGSISKFMPTYSQLNNLINQMLIERLSDYTAIFNQMDLTCIIQGYSDEKMYFLAMKRVFQLKNVSMSLLYTILSVGCAAEIVEKVFQCYVKNITKQKQINVFDGYKVAIALSDKGYRHLYLEQLESVALSKIHEFNDLKGLNDYCHSLIVLLGRARYLTPSINYLLGKLDYRYLSDRKRAQLIHSLILMDWCNSLDMDYSFVRGNILGIYSMTWFMYMCRTNYSLNDLFHLLKLCMNYTGMNTNGSDGQERTQLVKSVYMLLNILDNIIPIENLTLDFLVSCNNIVRCDITNQSKMDYTYSKYSNVLYEFTRCICMKEMKREALAGLDYRIDLLITN